MGATKFLKNYTQEKCEKALNDGFAVEVLGDIRPLTDKISTPHEVREVKEGNKIIGYNINKIYLSQSDDWDKYFNIIKEKPDQIIPGFPFYLKWPKMYGNKKYQIILVSGRILEARVDDAREFMSEGLEWKTREGNKEKQLVAAWKELWER